MSESVTDASVSRVDDPPQSPDTISQTIGLVLGSMDSTPLDFWVGVREGSRLQLDDIVTVVTTTGDGQCVSFYGIVDIVRKRFEGSQFDTDAFRVADEVMPADVSYAAHVQVTRLDPEIFVPPGPGDSVRVVRGEEFRRALYFDRMERTIPIGLTRTGEPIHANLEFLDGTRGAHASISGVSGVATKTSYAAFLLYSLFHSEALGLDAANAKALIFNVKGEDLLWLETRGCSRSIGQNTRASGCPSVLFRASLCTRRRARIPWFQSLTLVADRKAYVLICGRFASSRATDFSDSCSPKRMMGGRSSTTLSRESSGRWNKQPDRETETKPQSMSTGSGSSLFSSSSTYSMVKL